MIMRITIIFSAFALILSSVIVSHADAKDGKDLARVNEEAKVVVSPKEYSACMNTPLPNWRIPEESPSSLAIESLIDFLTPDPTDMLSGYSNKMSLYCHMLSSTLESPIQ